MVQFAFRIKLYLFQVYFPTLKLNFPLIKLNFIIYIHCLYFHIEYFHFYKKVSIIGNNVFLQAEERGQRKGKGYSHRVKLYVTLFLNKCYPFCKLGRSFGQSKTGHFDLTTLQPSPQEFPPPEIDFFDVLDDFEQKTKKNYWYKKMFGVRK